VASRVTVKGDAFIARPQTIGVSYGLSPLGLTLGPLGHVRCQIHRCLLECERRGRPGHSTKLGGVHEMGST